MCDNKKKSFIPPDFRSKDISPILLGDDFQYGCAYTQGFDRTGEYYLLLKHFNEYDGIENVLIYIIHFDKENLVYEKKELTIETPIQDQLEGRFLRNWVDLDSRQRQVVYALEMKRDDEIIFDIYYFYIVDFLKMKKYKEITIKPIKPDITLKYNEQQYDSIKEHDETFHTVDKDTTALIFKAFLSPREENENVQAICSKGLLDFLFMRKDKIWLAKSVIFDDLKIPREIVDYMPCAHFTEDKIFYYDDILHEDDDILRIYEYNFAGKFLNSYSIDRTNFYFEFIENSPCLLLYPPNINSKDCLMKILKLEEGRSNSVIKELNALDTFNMIVDKKEFFSWSLTNKRYGETRLHLQGNNVVLYDWDSKRTTSKISASDVFSPSLSLNWNREEIGCTFHKENGNWVDGNAEIFFKALVVEKNESMYLKHLARLAVLTSFDRDYLVKQNFPSSLVDYLGL